MNNFLKLIEDSRNSLLSKVRNFERNTNGISLNKICEDVHPFEYFMQIPNRMKVHKFFKDIKIGDVVIGCVTHVYATRIEVYLICTTGVLLRDIDSLQITAVCFSNELPILSNFSSIKAFRCGDKIKAIVTKISRNESLEISMNESSSMNKFQQTDLGLISDENLPSYFKRYRGPIKNHQYFNELFAKNELNNLIEIKDKFYQYGIKSDGFSLFDQINRVQISPNETAKGMRSALLLKESMKYVIKGVNYYKLKKLNEALQCYNHALSINEANVDALVARGALRASSKAFELSIEDLERAVKIDPDHKNAALYLSQTIVAYSKSLPETEEMKVIPSKDHNDYKQSVIDIRDPNHFIIITDDDTDDSSKSSNYYKKRKNRKTKKYKGTDREILSDSLSNDYKKDHAISIISSTSSDSYDNRKVSTINLNNRKRKIANSHGINNNKREKRRSSSFCSDSSLDELKKSRNISDHRYKYKDLWINKQDIKSRKFRYSHTRSGNKRSQPMSHSDASTESLDREKEGRQTLHVDDKLNSHIWQKHKHVSMVHHMDSYIYNNEREVAKNDAFMASDLKKENLRLKKVDEDIKQIEDFISTLRQSVQ